MIRTPSWSSASVAATASSSSSLAEGEEVEKAAQVAALVGLELAAMRISLRTLASRSSARPRISTARS